MKAITQDRYGSADALELRDIERPRIADDEVLVHVHAACLDRGELHLMTGLPYMLRVMGFGFTRPKVRVRGTDIAGTVEAVGGDVTEFAPGHAVFGFCEGAFAEYASAREDKLVAMPANLSFEQAAALPASATAALQFVRDLGAVEPGHRVLIIGAGGGVGTFAVQIARDLGAEVTGVCSTAKVDLVRSLGADHVIDYTREEIDSAGQTYDVILDTAGNRPISRLRRALTPQGTLLIAGSEGGRLVGGTQRNLWAILLSPFVSQTLRAPFLEGRKQDLEAVRKLAEDGVLTPAIDRTYPLSEVSGAFRRLDEGRAKGKIVISI